MSKALHDMGTSVEKTRSTIYTFNLPKARPMEFNQATVADSDRFVVVDGL